MRVRVDAQFKQFSNLRNVYVSLRFRHNPHIISSLIISHATFQQYIPHQLKFFCRNFCALKRLPYHFFTNDSFHVATPSTLFLDSIDVVIPAAFNAYDKGSMIPSNA